MDPEKNVEQTDIDDAIDPELEALFSEAEGTADEQDSTQVSGTQEADEFTERLRTLGVEDLVPNDIDPETKELVSRVVTHADKRVRDFQAGFDRARGELSEKAKVYDQLMALPQFHKFLGDLQNPESARAAAPVVEEKPKLDLASLPSDPVERLGHIVRFFAKEAIDEAIKPVNEQVGVIGNVVRNTGWESFVAKHPDAPEYASEMRMLIGKGHTLDEAYRYAKGASIDEKAIEDRTLTRVKGYVEKRKRASGAGLKTNSPRGSDPATDIVAYSKEHGHEAAVSKAIREAMEQHLGTD